jgi:hypothetical protein
VYLADPQHSLQGKHQTNEGEPKKSCDKSHSPRVCEQRFDPSVPGIYEYAKADTYQEHRIFGYRFKKIVHSSEVRYTF